MDSPKAPTATRPTFTPGPWRVGYFSTTVITEARERVRPAYLGDPAADCWVVDTSRGHRDPEECEANARLIAAAPELYEALGHLLDGIESFPGALPPRFHDAMRGYSLMSARAALAKADGR